MTPIRSTCLFLLLCLLASARTAQAQCSATTAVTQVTCFGFSNGSIDLTPSNGTAPYNYLWSNAAITEDLSNLIAGTYTCTVTDALNCTTTASATVTEPTQITIDLGGPVTLNCFTTSVQIQAVVNGGTPPYNYSWFSGETTAVVTILSPGSYGLTVTDAIGCTAASSAVVVSDASVPVSIVMPPPTLTCVSPTAVLDGTFSSVGPNFVYQWTTIGGNIISGANTLTPIINAPGNYNLIVINAINGCASESIVVVNQDIAPPPVNAGPDVFLPCGGGITNLMGVEVPGGNISYDWSTPDGHLINGLFTPTPTVDAPGHYTLTTTNLVNGCTASDIAFVLLQGSLCSVIQGRVIQDTTSNCLTDAGEPPLSGWIVKAVGTTQTNYGVTDANGDYVIVVEAGDTYSVSAVALSPLWLPCPSIPDITVINPGETHTAADLLYQKLAGCPALSVDISSGNLRRCFSTNFFTVSYCNNGTEPAEDAFVLVTLDAFLSPVSSSIPYTDLGAGVLRFNVGDLAIGECHSFNFNALLSCDAALGQTHCTEAHIYPDSSCIPPDLQWSGASLRISSECQSDSVHFRIENVGTGNMPNALDYIIIEDLVMLMAAPVQLDAGDFTTVSVPANGSTWRLEVEQEPFHPGQSAPAVSVEGCTTGTTFSTGFVVQFPADDADEFVDIDCKANVASSDPNDKQAFPLGYGAQHYIRPGTPLEYQIQFQNTGNDTAFTVRIVDTLSAWLDPGTIRPGAGSHPYTWDLNGLGVLSFRFDNILLPDSNVNEAASHGFVKFTINPRADAPLETIIENTAEIYFDFNDAVVTNTTFHRLGENFVTVGLWQPQQPGYEVLVSPNPFSEAALLEVKGLPSGAPLHLQVFDLQGKVQLEMNTEGSVFQLKKGLLSNGIYLFNIEQAGKKVGVGKLIIQD